MEIINVVPNTPEWDDHRALHFNASDAPAMLGESPYKTRTQLLDEIKTGVKEPVKEKVQKIFDKGHIFEALARPLAQKIIGEELFQLVGAVGMLSASFDGLTMLNDIAFEHKTMNADLRETIINEHCGANLAKHYRVQMEQQLLVSGADKCLFMATKWDDQGELIEERHCWYYPDADLRKEIIDGWQQFEIDLQNHVPQAAEKPKAVAGTIIDLPSVVAQVSGELAIKNNFADFGAALADFVANRLIKEPQTDQDFADLDAQIKTLKKAEDALTQAGNAALAQVSTLDEMMRTKDALLKLARDNRLMAEKLLKAEKENRKREFVLKRQSALQEHVATLQTGISVMLPMITADFAGAIKGKSSLVSIADALDTELASSKIKANQIADHIRASLKMIDDANHPMLFADKQALAEKDHGDLANIIKLRIAENEATEKQKAEIAESAAAAAAAAERARIAEIERQDGEKSAAEAERIKREDNAEYAQKIVQEVFDDFKRLGADSITATALIENIKIGAIRHIKIVY